MTFKKLFSKVHDKVSHSSSNQRTADQGTETDKAKTGRLSKWRTSKKLDSTLIFNVTRTPPKQPPPAQDDRLNPFHSGIMEIPSPDWHHSRSKAPSKNRSIENRLSAEFNQEKKPLAFLNRRPFSYSAPNSGTFVGVEQVIDALRLPISPRPSSDNATFDENTSVITTSTQLTDTSPSLNSSASEQHSYHHDSYVNICSAGNETSFSDKDARQNYQRQSVPSFSVFRHEKNTVCSVRESSTLPGFQATHDVLQFTPAPCLSKEVEDLCVKPRPHSFADGSGLNTASSPSLSSFRRRNVTQLAGWSEKDVHDEPNSWRAHASKTVTDLHTASVKDNDGVLQRRLGQTIMELQKSTSENELLKERVQTLQAAVLASEERKKQAESESCRQKLQIDQMSQESKSIRKEINDLTAVYKESSHSMISKNQHLEKFLRQLQQEIDAMTDENRRLQKRLKKDLIENSPLYTPDSESTSTLSGHNQQDELLRMHTRAQLGLIEYLEGESDVATAMARFKKQLEAEARDLFGEAQGETDKLYESTMDVSVFGLGENTRPQSYAVAKPMR